MVVSYTCIISVVELKYFSSIYLRIHCLDTYEIGVCKTKSTTMASPAALVVNLAEEESENDLDDHLVGSGEYQIVGIRYYAGVAHPGEYVVLVREPRNREL